MIAEFHPTGIRGPHSGTARGKDTDKRADIFAFGVVLHELIAARRLFGAAKTSANSRQK